MKHLTLLIISFFTLILSTCTKDEYVYNCNFDTSIQSFGTVIDDSLSNYYFQIWKTFLLEKNNMAEDYYSQHITQTAMSSNEWVGGISFRVDYIMNIDWIDIPCHDKFFIKMDSSYDPYQYLNIPRDIFFNQSEIEFNIANNVDSEISTYNLVEKLKYDNCIEVCEAVKKASGYENFSPYQVSYYVPGNLPREDGNPYIMLRGTIDESENRCLKGHINLVTGGCTMRETVCYIIN